MKNILWILSVLYCLRIVACCSIPDAPGPIGIPGI